MRWSGGSRRERVWFLDEVRGVCILLMVLYHAAYDVVYLFGCDIPLFHSALLRFAQPFVAGIFILISGIACRYSRSNLRRGLLTLGLGLAMTAFTLRFLPGQAIYFGILHLLGTGMIVVALLHRLLDRIPPGVGVTLCAVLFLLTRRTSGGVIGLPGVLAWSVPDRWRGNLWLTPIGLTGAGADFFPLLPWLFLFLAGAYVGVWFTGRRMLAFFYRSHAPRLAWIGRHTIWIYLLHQPVVYGVLWVFFTLAGRLAA